MADESKTGILGHLPPLPRPALNNSVIGMEQAYRQRKGLQLLTDADIEALKAGQPMPWEVGGVAPPAASAPAATVATRCGGGSSGTSCGGAEQSARKLPNGSRRETSGANPRSPLNRRDAGARDCLALNNAEMSALLGEPVEASAPAAAARPDPGCSCPGGKSRQRPDQRGSCQVGGGRKEVEQVHHRR